MLSRELGNLVTAAVENYFPDGVVYGVNIWTGELGKRRLAEIELVHPR